MAERLARAGLKVVVVEQIETPDMLKARNEERSAKGLKKVGRRAEPGQGAGAVVQAAAPLGGCLHAGWLHAGW